MGIPLYPPPCGGRPPAFSAPTSSWTRASPGPRTRDPETVLRVLEPLVTDARRARLREVIGRRLASVAVVFDRPYDPHNGAAVIRSCEAFGVQQLHVVERPGTPFAVARSVARGAEKWIDVTCHAAPRFGRRLGARARHAPGRRAPRGRALARELGADVRASGVVLGNEREGIRRRTRPRVHARASGSRCAASSRAST